MKKIFRPNGRTYLPCLSISNACVRLCVIIWSRLDRILEPKSRAMEIMYPKASVHVWICIGMLNLSIVFKEAFCFHAFVDALAVFGFI